MRLLIKVTLILALTTDIHGQTADELNQQAIDLNKKGETKKAFDKIEKSIKQDPNKKETYFIRGGIYFANKDLIRAEENLKKAIQLDTTYAEPYDYLSAIYFSLKDIKKGLEYLDKSIELQPTATRLLGRADLKGMKGDYLGAIRDCDEVLNADPNNSSAYFIRGNSKFGVRDREGACADLKRAIELGKPKDNFFIKYCEN